MISDWTPQEIANILTQLDKKQLPFSGYTLRGCQLLGSGSFAAVYSATKRNGGGRYAIKVTGFGEKHIDPKEFDSTMSAQMRLSHKCKNIVRIYDYAQLYVCLDSSNRVVRVQHDSAAKNAEPPENCLLLQFAVLERLTPVVERKRYGGLSVTVKQLAEGDETEIFRLGKQIGAALKIVHDRKMLHRDIKLENIFYDSVHKQYKLGDFGIARVVQEGLASTVAFTKGYGAPEIVVTGQERYDCTADIYSFGMVLFVLLNELRFPDSDCYHVNAGAQYCPGYILPSPSLGSEDAAQLVQKMCRFSPDDRYQSMTEVCDEMSRLGLAPVLKNRSINYKTLAVLSGALLILGVGILILCEKYPDSTDIFQNNLWVSPLMISLACLFGCQSIALRKPMCQSLQWSYSLLIWGGMMLIYALLIVRAKLPIVAEASVKSELIEVIVPGLIQKYQGDKIGVGGLIVCLLWLLRERYQMKRDAS